MEEEEREMFPRVRKAMGKDELRRLGEELQQRKQEVSVGVERMSVA